MVGRQARAEVTRQSIIDAGVAVFGEMSYGDADMTDVVQRAGVPGGTCYYYFPTKGSLADAIIEHSPTPESRRPWVHSGNRTLRRSID